MKKQTTAVQSESEINPCVVAVQRSGVGDKHLESVKNSFVKRQSANRLARTYSDIWNGR
jgi:hypothetical protein